MHGYAIAQRIQQVSSDVLQVQQGSLYPALHRLENKGFLTGEWKQSDIPSFSEKESPSCSPFSPVSPWCLPASASIA
ncbi:MAG TPA: helix-turn-helix transcriptional regulator [Bryobacteraceae bacterium]